MMKKIITIQKILMTSCHNFKDPLWWGKNVSKIKKHTKCTFRTKTDSLVSYFGGNFEVTLTGNAG